MRSDYGFLGTILKGVRDRRKAGNRDQETETPGLSGGIQRADGSGPEDRQVATCLKPRFIRGRSELGLRGSDKRCGKTVMDKLTSAVGRGRCMCRGAVS